MSSDEGKAVPADEEAKPATEGEAEAA